VIDFELRPHLSELRPRPSKLVTKTSELSSKLFEQPGELLSLLRPLVASIAAKNGATTTATTIIMTGRKAQRPGNFIAIDQFSIQRYVHFQYSYLIQFFLTTLTCLPEDLFLLIFYNRLVDRAPSFLEFSELAPSLASPYTYTGPALCASGGRRTLPGLTCALLRANRLHASHSDLRLVRAIRIL
jgi:hypothetical protein